MVIFLTSCCLAAMGIQTHIHTQTEERDIRSTQLSELRCHDIHTRFLKDLSRHSKLNRTDKGDTQQRDHISLLLFLENKERRLKILIPTVMYGCDIWSMT
jgi:hypothetical protein